MKYRTFPAPIVLILACLAAPAAATEGITALPYDSQGTVFLLDREPYLEVRFAGWGPGWAWQSFRGELEADGNAGRAVSRTTIAASGAEVEIATRTVPTGPRQLAIEVEITSDRDTDLTMLMAGLQPAARAFRGGKAVVAHADGRTTTIALPPGRGNVGEQVQRLLLTDADGRQTSITLEPPLEVSTDGDVRIGLARKLTARQPVQAKLTIDLPQAFTPWASEEPLGRCFAVRHGPLAIVGLDTGEDKPDARPVFAGLADFEPYRRAQRDWLIAAMKRRDIAAAPFVVACCHIPLNGLPGHNGGDTGEGYAYFSRQSQQLWGPVLEEAGVQLVICGHMHQFRYDAPEGNRSWGQLVGGGPQPARATLIRGRATADALTVTAHRLDGTDLGQWTYRARKA